MPHAPEEVAVVTIDAIAAGGDGIGRHQGMACFIPRTAPGDVVQVALQVRARHARGRVLQLLTASPARTPATCRHYEGDRCGGCQLQHLELSAQRAAKASIVRDALVRIGRRDIDVPVVEASPDAWGYRRKLTLTLIHRGQGWVGGLHPLDDADAVFALEECPIADPALLAAWNAVKVASRQLPTAPRLRLMLRLLAPAQDGGQRFAAVVTGGASWTNAEQFAWNVPGLEALWWHTDAGDRHVIVAPRDVDVAAASFVQVNRGMAARMLDHVEARVRDFKPVTVIDAYAGTGLLSLRLAQTGVQVTALEWDRDAVRALQGALPSGSRAIASAVEAALPDALPADVVVLNPPRTGVDQRVTAALSTAAVQGVRAIVYVSCDPATLARDLHRLPGWRIDVLRCFDMFPQTAHVETVCVLVPEAA